MRLSIFSWFRARRLKRDTPTEIVQAQLLVQAVDRGGIPLNPAKVNAIARNLGLEVSLSAPVDKTIDRIRCYLDRHTNSGH